MTADLMRWEFQTSGKIHNIVLDQKSRGPKMLENFAYWLFNSILWLLIDPEGQIAFWMIWTFSMLIGFYLAVWMWPECRSRDVNRVR